MSARVPSTVVIRGPPFCIPGRQSHPLLLSQPNPLLPLDMIIPAIESLYLSTLSYLPISYPSDT